MGKKISEEIITEECHYLIKAFEQFEGNSFGLFTQLQLLEEGLCDIYTEYFGPFQAGCHKNKQL